MRHITKHARRTDGSCSDPTYGCSSSRGRFYETRMGWLRVFCGLRTKSTTSLSYRYALLKIKKWLQRFGANQSFKDIFRDIFLSLDTLGAAPVSWVHLLKFKLAYINIQPRNNSIEFTNICSVHGLNPRHALDQPITGGGLHHLLGIELSGVYLRKLIIICLACSKWCCHLVKWWLAIAISW